VSSSALESLSGGNFPITQSDRRRKMEKVRTTTEIAKELGVSSEFVRRYIKKHLEKLIELGVVKEEKKGLKRRVFKILCPGEEFLRVIRKLEGLDEKQSF
jgi:predicted transcriptional regulator